MNVALIAGMTKERVIGKGNDLPWHISEDLKNFKEVTDGQTVVMGKNTLDSIGKPLPGRNNIVLNKERIEIEGVDVCTSIPEALEKAKSALQVAEANVKTATEKNTRAKLTTSIKKTQQKLSTKATVSIVTCGSGDELYSTFGHSAFRVFDPPLILDKIYNYGTFDFNAPNFYLNFAKGKLIYQLSTSTFSRFLREYQYEKRWVKTQELNLSTNQVQEVFNF